MQSTTPRPDWHPAMAFASEIAAEAARRSHALDSKLLGAAKKRRRFTRRVERALVHILKRKAWAFKRLLFARKEP